MTIQMDSGDVHWREDCRTYWCYMCENSTEYEHRCLNCEKKKLEYKRGMTINELVEKVKHFQKDKGFPTLVELNDTAYLMFRNSLLLNEVAELFTAIHNKGEIEIADGLADVIYIVIGTCVILNVPIDEVLAEVHKSNMTKDKGAVKGKDFILPDIKKVYQLKRIGKGI